MYISNQDIYDLNAWFIKIFENMLFMYQINLLFVFSLTEKLDEPPSFNNL